MRTRHTTRKSSIRRQPSPRRSANSLRIERLEDRMVLSGASPMAVNDLFQTIVDQPLQVQIAGVLANDTDAEGDALAAGLFSGPSHGTLEFREDGSFDYTPDAGFVGFDSFIYFANDGTSDSMLAAATIQVRPPNDKPAAANDVYHVDEDSSLTMDALAGLLANDTDADGDVLTPTLASQPLHGEVTIADDGSFVYTPEPGFSGLDGFSYFVSDGLEESDVASVTIIVHSVNDSPVAVNDEYTVDEDTPLVIEAPGLLANDSDADGDALSVTLVNPPLHGVVTLNADGSFLYTPDVDFNGVDGFSYIASDGAGTSEAAGVTINVSAVNDAPAATADAYSVDEDSSLVVDAASGVLANDTDAEGDALTASLVTGPANGTLSLGADGSFTYTPNVNFSGTDSFVYAASDGALTTESTVTITVNEVADAPLTAIDHYSTGEDVPLVVGTELSVLANDIDPTGEGLTAEIVDGPQHGTLTWSADGTFTYTPQANYHGSDSFTYKAKNATEETISTANIVIEPLNDRPVAVSDEFTITAGAVQPADAAPQGNVMANDSDIDGDPLTATLVSGPAHGTLTLSADGSFSYVPEDGFTGDDTFRYQLFDGLANSNVATVTLHVQSGPEQTPVPNQRPLAVNESFTLQAGTTLQIPAATGLLANDLDPEGLPISAELFSGPLHGTLSLAGDGSFNYVPNDGFVGLDAFLYRAYDGELYSALAAVTLHVTPGQPASSPTPEPEPAPTPEPCDVQHNHGHHYGHGKQQALAKLSDRMLEALARRDNHAEAVDVVFKHGRWRS